MTAHAVDKKDVINIEQNTKQTYEYGDKWIIIWTKKKMRKYV